MEDDSGRSRLARLLLVVGIVTVILLAGCVQGDEPENDTGFDPEGTTGGGSGGSTGGSTDGGGSGGSDGEQDPNETSRLAAKGFDTLTAEEEVMEELNRRREAIGKQPLQHSQSLKVSAAEYSTTLAKRDEVTSKAKNSTIQNLTVKRDEIIARYERNNAFGCRKSGTWIYAQLNHVTLFNRTLETSKERLIKYDNEELIALAAVEDWMDRSETRKIILETGYREAGVGIFYEESTDIVYTTVNFC